MALEIQSPASGDIIAPDGVLLVGYSFSVASSLQCKATPKGGTPILHENDPVPANGSDFHFGPFTGLTAGTYDIRTDEKTFNLESATSYGVIVQATPPVKLTLGAPDLSIPNRVSYTLDLVYDENDITFMNMRLYEYNPAGIIATNERRSATLLFGLKTYNFQRIPYDSTLATPIWHYVKIEAYSLSADAFVESSAPAAKGIKTGAPYQVSTAFKWTAKKIPLAAK